MPLLSLLIETLNITLPVFAMVILGIVLKRLNWIDHAFIDTGSSLVFKGAMPTLIFISIADADFSQAFRPAVILYFVMATVISFMLTWGWACRRIPPADRGVYVQGAFRGNCGIVGLALAASMYGDTGLSIGGILAGAVIVIYNVLSVIVLALYQPGARISPVSIAARIAKNPLIISVLAALVFVATGLHLPQWLHTSAEYFARMTLPLALICIGGTLSLASVMHASREALGASLIKMVAIPLGAVSVAALLGFRNEELGILFLYFASPSAATSFVMAKAMNGNHVLAANIIAITTLSTGLVITLGIFLLQAGGLL
ncbi:AEC family transporter [Larsenimonas rhizosphaerae]|uniref:AEC family transporter n=1 Tax=Larsenimonas rhizosphaerae TaxID=2944682 RepID=A0AA41ZLY0_9GAMM|nr:AEC family transporter [Larsenimonas rhizosphaerae]MCX2523275.1 AEC family transporter [Larsenimonas rhizosphaerae]